MYEGQPMLATIRGTLLEPGICLILIWKYKQMGKNSYLGEMVQYNIIDNVSNITKIISTAIWKSTYSTPIL